jgi:hypothetical protein
MDHPSMRQMARYALGEITNDTELAAFEEHLLACEDCRRRAVAVDLIGTAPAEADEKPPLHIAAGSAGTSVALCGEDGSRSIISEILLPGLDAAIVCPKCLALMRAGADGKQQQIN